MFLIFIIIFCTKIISISQTLLQKRQDFKSHVQSKLSKWLPEEKVLQLDTPTDAFNVLRRVGTQKQRTVSYRDKRAHLLAEEIKFKCNEVGIDVIIIYTN